MDIVIDTSALIAVLVDEPERTKIVDITVGNTLIGPGSIPWEVGNAFSAMFKQNRLTLNEAQKGLAIFQSIPIRYVEPDFFSGVISGLTDGNSAREFVDEVVNLKNQLISYGSGLGDTYQWSAETLTEGRGKCGDTSILIASLLKAGENEANYGLDVYIWYCDADNIANPQEVNHAIVGVEYSDGSSELIETTTDDYYHIGEIVGWKYEV